MISLKAPHTNYTNQQDIGKFKMMWEICLLLIPAFSVLFIVHLVYNDSNWITSLAAIVIFITNLLFMYKTRKYKLVASISVLLGFLVCQVLIFVVVDAKIISDALWCVIVGVLTFYLIGPILGSIVFMLNITSLVLFLYTDIGHSFLLKALNEGEDNSKMIVNIYYVAITLTYIIYRIMKNNKDINNRYQEEISRNEILLKEIHHRVKNNLQIISSLLRLQAAETRNVEIDEHFTEAVNRIRSMALIHEKMYGNDDLSKLDIKSYLETLVEDITNSINSSANIDLKVESEVSNIDIKGIVPISLIFNELITNSLKHGFEGGARGIIKVDIVFGKGVVVFSYYDNGVWKEPKSESTFGFELIKSLVQQLDGKCSRRISNGTSYEFKFDSNVMFYKLAE
ncbi:MAG: sensor histidine kinase [Crocinitomicaceae bacterium]|nr:sensor histidine kinase [Crocinitomicaceae bacterium]